MSFVCFLLKRSSIQKCVFCTIFFSAFYISKIKANPLARVLSQSKTKKVLIKVASKDKGEIAKNLIYFPALSNYLFGLSAVHSGRFELYELSGQLVEEKISSKLVCVARSRIVYVVKSNMFSIEMSEDLSLASCQQKIDLMSKIKLTKLK